MSEHPQANLQDLKLVQAIEDIRREHTENVRVQRAGHGAEGRSKMRGVRSVQWGSLQKGRLTVEGVIVKALALLKPTILYARLAGNNQASNSFQHGADCCFYRRVAHVRVDTYPKDSTNQP